MSISDLTSSVSSALGAAAPASTKQNASEISKTSDQFLTMLVTQIKNQDPLNPMDNAAVTSQLAQISTVSGINQLNATLQSLVGQTDMNQSIQASALIGKDVLVGGSSIKVGGGTQTYSGIDLVSKAAKVTVTIQDSSGHVVRTIETGTQEAGILGTGWDGLNNSGQKVPDGAYTMSVKALDDAGAAVVANTLMSGKVNSVAYSPTGTKLDLGLAGSVAMADIKKIM